MALSFSQSCLEWARSKPADEAYDYHSCERCAIALFLLETGRANPPAVGNIYWQSGYGAPHRLPERVSAAARNDYDRSGWTFGAFADRLERAMS